MEETYQLTWRDGEVFSASGTMEWCLKTQEAFGGDIAPTKPYVPLTEEQRNDPTVITKRRYGCVAGYDKADEPLMLCSYEPELLKSVIEEIQDVKLPDDWLKSN